MPQLARSNGGASISWASRCSRDPRSGTVRGRPVAVWAAAVELIVNDARISLRIDQVRQEVYQQEHQGHEQYAALDRREIALLDRGEHVATQARPSEDGFREDAAGQVAARVESQYRDHRNER